MTASEPRPRVVTVAFWLWTLAAVLLIAAGLSSLLSEALIGFYRYAGVLWLVAGIGLGFLAGRTRQGDARFRRAGVALSLALVLLLAVFSLMSQGLIWLPIMIVVMAAAVLMMRPSAQDWFTQDEERDPHA